MKTFLFLNMDSAHDPGFHCVPDPWNKLTRRGLGCLLKANVPSLLLSDNRFYKALARFLEDPITAPASGLAVSTYLHLRAGLTAGEPDI